MIKYNRGFSFVEVTVAAAILSMAIVAFMGSTNFFNKRTKDSQESILISNYVGGIYNSIQSNLDLYQVTYDSKDFYDTTSPEKLQEKLPLGWDSTQISKKETCSGCVGRMGYIIEPISGYRGLYKLTVRVTHPKIEGFRDYTMILVGK
jgi:prepilin-type N-terminal cleavage/methylation domain-containing protein